MKLALAVACMAVMLLGLIDQTPYRPHRTGRAAQLRRATGTTRRLVRR